MRTVMSIVLMSAACWLWTAATVFGAGVRQERRPAPAAAASTDGRPADTQEEPVDIGTAVYVGENMVRGYDPRSELVLPETDVPRSRFPSIDMHCHWTTDVDPNGLLEAMDDRNVRVAINLSGGPPANLEMLCREHSAISPDRLIMFCNLDFGRCGEVDFDAYVVDTLRSARDLGARGLKIYKSLGLRTRDANDELLRIDDHRLDIVWRTCAELGFPVLIHSADPAAFFRPINENNERWMQLYRHPDWSFYGEEFPPRAEVLGQRARVLRRHPDTTFIAAHLGGYSENLAAAREVLDAHPNLYMDVAGRVAELGRQPYTARRFLMDFHDRILFGTDRYPGRPDQPRYRIYFRFFETDDEYFKYYDHPFPPTGEWRIYGVYLPDDVLRNIYHDNAARVLGLPLLKDLADERRDS